MSLDPPPCPRSDLTPLEAPPPAAQRLHAGSDGERPARASFDRLTLLLAQADGPPLLTQPVEPPVPSPAAPWLAEAQERTEEVRRLCHAAEVASQAAVEACERAIQLVRASRVRRA